MAHKTVPVATKKLTQVIEQTSLALNGSKVPKPQIAVSFRYTELRLLVKFLSAFKFDELEDHGSLGGLMKGGTTLKHVTQNLHHAFEVQTGEKPF